MSSGRSKLGSDLVHCVELVVVPFNEALLMLSPSDVASSKRCTLNFRGGTYLSEPLPGEL